MIASMSDPISDPKVLVFGPQALTFDVQSFNNIRIQLQETLHYRWTLDTVAALPNDWNTLSKSVTKLQKLDGGKLLKDLNEWLDGGKIPQSSFPLPNILLSPLVVIAQLTQYSAFLKAALPDLLDTQELPTSIKTSTETLGLCTGTLSAFAVACSSSMAELQHYGAVAVRLAMLVGALVDAEEAPSNKSMSFSASWNSGEAGAAMKEVLDKFPEVKIGQRTPTFQ